MTSGVHGGDVAPQRRDRGRDDRRPRGRDRTAGRSRPARRRAATGSRSTTSCCASRRSSAKPPRTSARGRSPGEHRMSDEPSEPGRRRSRDRAARTAPRARELGAPDSDRGRVARARRDHVPVRVPDALVPRAAAAGRRGRARRRGARSSRTSELAAPGEAAADAERDRAARARAVQHGVPGRAGLQRACPRRRRDHHDRRPERGVAFRRLGRGMPATDSDVEALTVLLGRAPRGAFEVVVRDAAGEPVVIRNAPLLDDGTPMPTRYWLVDPDARDARLAARVDRRRARRRGRGRRRRAARRARAVRGRARRGAARRPRGPASARRRRRHAARREVPARALRLLPRRRRRSRRPLGRGARSRRGDGL